MDAFALSYSSVLQGDFTFAKRNLLLVFQVNCPGCFMYALPFAADLHRELANQDVKILGLSTAFEDFELNTPENTLALLQEKKLVGETRRVFAANDVVQAPFELEFPVAFDRLSASADFSDEDFQKIAEAQTGFETLAPDERARFIERVRDHYRGHEVLPETFTKNQLPGTPSWIVLTDTGEVLHRSFGRPTDPDRIVSALAIV